MIMTNCSVLGANYMEEVTRIILGTMNTVSGLTTAVGNLLIIIVILYYKSLRRPSNFLIVCLAIPDLAVGTVLQPVVSAQLFDASIGNDCNVAYAVTYIGAMLCGTSSWVLALISYDRYLHLVKLQNYNLHMTKTKMCSMVALCWVFPMCIGLFIFSDVTLDVYYTLLVLSVNGNVLVIVLCYRQSYKFMKQKSKSFTGRSEITPSKRQETEKINHHWKLAKTFAMIIACYLICWTPMVLFVFYLIVNRIAGLTFGSFAPYVYTVYYLTLLMGYTNSSMNPMIYFWRNRELRAGMKRFVAKFLLRRRVLPRIDATASVRSSSLKSGMFA